MAADAMKADLSRFRTYIQQGNTKKIEHLLNDQSKRLNYFLEQQFDACAQATKFKQERVLRLVHDYGTYLHLSNINFHVIVYVLGFPLDGYPRTHAITALIIAIRRNDLSFVHILVELGCDVNCSVRSYTIIPLLEAYQMCKNKQDNPFLFEVRSWYVQPEVIYIDLLFLLALDG
jgi:ankyrin repeat protein